MQAARRRAGFDFSRRLGRRAEAGPRQVLPRVRRRGYTYMDNIARSTCRQVIYHAAYEYVMPLETPIIQRDAELRFLHEQGVFVTPATEAGITGFAAFLRTI